MRLLGLLALVAMLPAPDATACSHPGGTGRAWLNVPPDGATGVPTNVAVTFLWRDVSTYYLPEVVLRKVGGAAVTADVKFAGWGFSYVSEAVVRISPAQPLEADTSYVVEARYTYPWSPTLEFFPIGGFTTGAGPASLPAPSRPPEPHVTLGPEISSLSATGFVVACGPRQVREGTLSISGGLVYTISDGHDVLAEDVRSPIALLVECPDPTAYNSDFDVRDRTSEQSALLLQPGIRQLIVSARDEIGQESGPTAFTIDATCAPVPDGPTYSNIPDAGGAFSGKPGTTSSGCSVARGSGGAPLLLLLILVARAAGWRRSRR
jgi:hypothetical protein